MDRAKHYIFIYGVNGINFQIVRSNQMTEMCVELDIIDVLSYTVIIEESDLMFMVSGNSTDGHYFH